MRGAGGAAGGSISDSPGLRAAMAPRKPGCPVAPGLDVASHRALTSLRGTCWSAGGRAASPPSEEDVCAAWEGVPAPREERGEGPQVSFGRKSRAFVCSTGWERLWRNVFSIVFYGRVLAECPISGQHNPGDVPLESFALP